MSKKPKKDAKEKKKKLTPEEEALQNAQNVNDIDDEGYKKTLREQARILEAEVRLIFDSIVTKLLFQDL